MIQPKTAEQVLTMMEAVLGKDGTGKSARVPGYRVAGKTGTARVAGKDGYKDRKYTASFMGIAPVSKPKFVVVVIINEPSRKGYYAAAVAAPFFSKVMAGALRLFNIPTDEVAELESINVKLTQLLKPWIKQAIEECMIKDIKNDSRLVHPGDLFIAYPGAVLMVVYL